MRLLRALPSSRVSIRVKAILAELERKFPNSPEDRAPSSDTGFGCVGAPISETAQARMNDDQWLHALEKYRGTDFASTRTMSGGEQELARSLEQRTRESPERFATLAHRLPDSMPTSYFEAILRGVAQSPHYDTAEKRNTTLASDFILRCHALPASPCGRDICWLVPRWSGSTWPETVLDTVAWYAMHDPNPTRDAWKPNKEGNNAVYGSDAFTAGINSVRGSATEAIGTLLFAMRESFLRLRPAVESVCRAPSLAVQSVAVKPLLAILNVEPVTAIAWFSDKMIANPDLLGTSSGDDS